MNVDRRIVLITGGGSGIGAWLAEAFAEAGARVAISDIDPSRAAAEGKRLAVMALEHDVTSLESWRKVRDVVGGTLGPVDILCNNAGVAQPFMPLDEMSPEKFAQIMEVNVTGVFNGVKTFAPDMKARRSGHIVNTSSVNGLVPHAPFAAYTASKFAVAGMSEALRMELAPFGVGVSILYPGLTRSRMSEGQLPDLSEDQAAALSVRMMEPVWLGRAVVRAIEANEQHVITHPAHQSDIEARMEAIYAAHGEPAQPGYQGGRFETN
jgi:NAD(P)-dependent dehydrogenase (short-subunit alcohol dehydrogenase family)